MFRRLTLALSLLGLVSGACTSGTEPGSTGHASLELTPGTLVLGTGRGPLSLHVPDGAVLFSRPGAVARYDGAMVYSTTHSEDSTLLRTIESSTGVTMSSTSVRGAFDLGVVSTSGRLAALIEPLPPGWDRQTPIPRARTHIVVADPTGAAAPRRYVLEGNFEPEAFSSNERRLFLIQHLPAEAPSAYRVAVLNLRRGEVGAVFGPFKSPPERMPGIRLQQLASPTGDQLYTLYSSARPGYAPHETVAGSSIVSFVHVLDLDEGWAHCVGLPRVMWDRPAGSQALAASPDGEYAYVVDAPRGVVAAMHSSSLEVRVSEVTFGSSDEIRRTSAVTSPDGDTLYVAATGKGSLITAVDVRTFEIGATWRLDDGVSGLGISRDGSKLYAATAGAVIVLDAATGSEIGEVPVAAPDEVVSVLAIAT